MKLKSPVLLEYVDQYDNTAIWPDDLPLPDGTTSEPGTIHTLTLGIVRTKKTSGWHLHGLQKEER
jgi:hypothetical protein